MIVLVLALVLQTKPSSEHQPRTPTNQANSTQKQQDAPTQNRSLPPTYNVTNRKEQQDDAEKVDERRDRKKQICIAVVGVAGAWFGLGLLIWQNILTRKAANAAKQSADGLINFERPWVMPQYHKCIHAESAKSTFKLSIFNYGKSPARIISCTTPIVRYCDPRVLAEYGKSLWSDQFLAPRDSLPLGEPINPRQVMINDNAEMLANGLSSTPEMKVVAYGAIEYGDGVSDKIYKTAYCFGIDLETFSDSNRRFDLCGPEPYNKYT